MSKDLLVRTQFSEHFTPYRKGNSAYARALPIILGRGGTRLGFLFFPYIVIASRFPNARAYMEANFPLFFYAVSGIDVGKSRITTMYVVFVTAFIRDLFFPFAGNFFPCSRPNFFFWGGGASGSGSSPIVLLLYLFFWGGGLRNEKHFAKEKKKNFSFSP